MSYSAWIMPKQQFAFLRVRRRLHDLAARVPPAGGERQTFVAVDHDAQVSRKAISLHRYSGCGGRSRRGRPGAATRGSRRCCSAPSAGPSRPTSWPAGWSRPWHAPRRPSPPTAGSSASPGNHLRRRLRQEHAATRVVDAHAHVLLDQPGHVRDEGRDDELDLADEVQQRRAAGRPAAAGEHVLVPVDRQVVKPLGLDHRRRHAGVVTIAFDQRGRTFRRSHAAGGIARTGVLRILLHQHVQLGTLVDQRLGRVVADDLPLAVRRAVLLRVVALDDLLDPRQMAGQRFVPLLLRHGARHRVRLDDRFGLGLRLGPSGLELLAAVERQPRLIRSREDAFLAPMAVDEMAQELPQLFHFDGEFLELLRLRRDGRRLLRKARGLNSQQRLAGLKIVGNLARLDHGTHDNKIAKKRKRKYAPDRQNFRKYSSRCANVAPPSRAALLQRRAASPTSNAYRGRRFTLASSIPESNSARSVASISTCAAAGGASRPLEGAAFQTLHPDRQAVPIPMDQLDAIQAAVEKQKHVPAADVASELGLHDGVEPVEALSHIGRLGVQVDLRLPQGRQKRGGEHRGASPVTNSRRLPGTPRRGDRPPAGGTRRDNESRPGSRPAPTPPCRSSNGNALRPLAGCRPSWASPGGTSAAPLGRPMTRRPRLLSDVSPNSRTCALTPVLVHRIADTESPLERYLANRASHTRRF